jgi:pentatricopeptide repeat domain-containing protein 3
MFAELKTKTAEAYCSLIKGMAKCNDDQNAARLYAEMKKYNLTPDVNTINSMIRLIQMSPPEITNDKKVELMIEKLNEIKSYGLMPTLRTFNTCLELIKSFSMYQKALQLALDLYKDMQNLSIEPSLATYSHIISIFHPTSNAGSKTGILKQVVEKVEEKAASGGLVWRDVNDSLFFKTVMEKLGQGNVDNLVLVKRVHALLLKDQNIKFLNDSHLYNRYL